MMFDDWPGSMKPLSQLPARTAQMMMGESYLLDDAADTVTVMRRIGKDACEVLVTMRHSGDCVLRLRIDIVAHIYKAVFIDPYFWTFHIDGRAATQHDLEESSLGGYSGFHIDATHRRFDLQR
jgi:hypothetical protein